MLFRVTVRRVKVDVVCIVSVAVHFWDTLIEFPFLPFRCTDQVPVCGVKDTVHSAKKVVVCFLIRGRPGCGAVVQEKEGEDY